MKLSSQQDYMIAGSQYTRGFTDRRANPANQPNASGTGSHYYAEGFSDAAVSPAHTLGEYVNKETGKPIFAALTEEDGEDGMAFVVALRKVAAGIKVDVGDDPKSAIPKLMNQLQCAVGDLMNAAIEKASTDRLVKALREADRKAKEEV